METELTDGTVLLRPFRPEDIEPLYEAVRESILELSVWMPWCHEDYALEDSRSFVISRAESWQNGTEYTFVICDATRGELLGVVSLNLIVPLHRYANLGYWVRTNRTGRGIATRATVLLARFGLTELDFNRIEIVAATGNPASQRVAEKACARREGLLRKRLLIRDRPHDALMFSLVAEDFDVSV